MDEDYVARVRMHGARVECELYRHGERVGLAYGQMVVVGRFTNQSVMVKVLDDDLDLSFSTWVKAVIIDRRVPVAIDAGVRGVSLYGVAPRGVVGAQR